MEAGKLSEPSHFDQLSVQFCLDLVSTSAASLFSLSVLAKV